MADGITKISANLPDDFLDILKDLAAKRRTTMTEVLKSAIITEKTLSEEVTQGGRILIENKDKSLKQLIKHT